MSNGTNKLKLEKVVLFKSGIGSFQKKGIIDLSQTKSIKVNFKDSVINDLLKTFSILRESGDLSISGVSYEAKETDQSKLLEDSDINLPEENSFSALLGQLRGIDVKIHHFNELFEGKVLGMQNFPEAGEGEAVIDKNYLILASNSEDSSIKTIKMDEITGLEILNPKVRKDLQFFLEIITGQNKQKHKTINLFFNGEQKSEYLLNFLQETPAWKTTYRIFLKKDSVSANNEDDGKVSAGETPNENAFGEDATIQAWAIIDNVLDEDWDNVDLTLVSGLPISFIYDSYSPAWKMRPEVERETDLGVNVVQLEKTKAPGGGFTRRDEAKAMPAPKMKMARKRARPAPMMDMMAEEEEAMPSAEPPAPMGSLPATSGDAYDMDDEYDSAFEVGSEAKGGKGVAMKYRISNPVYVKRNNSSLIPLLNFEAKAKMVSIYNEKMNDSNPIKTITFTNKDFTLEKGPISVFINQTFAGEAILPFLDSGADARVLFAVDQAVEVNRKVKNRTRSVHEIMIESYVYKRFFRTKTTVYSLENLGDEKKNLILEHNKTRGYKLYNSKEPDDESSSCYAYILVLEPNEKKKFALKERKLDFSQTQKGSVSMADLEDWMELKLISKEEYRYLQDRLELNGVKSTVQSKINRLSSKLQDIITQQQRIRKNLSSLKESESDKRLRERYVQKMEIQEDSYEDLKEKLQQSKAKMEEIDQKMKKLDKTWLKKVEERKEKSGKGSGKSPKDSSEGGK